MTYTPNSEYQPPMPEPPMLQPQMVVTPWGLPFYVSGNEAHDRKMYFEQIRREMHNMVQLMIQLYETACVTNSSYSFVNITLLLMIHPLSKSYHN